MFAGQGWNGVCGSCTISRQNSHSTAFGDCAMVAYAWHPWAGKTVRVREVIERAGGRVMRSALEDAGVGRDQEIPAWMLDAAFCRMMQAVTDPVADLRTLVALQALLAEVTATISASRPKRTTLASPEPNRGDRHGTPQRPNLDTSPSTRPLRHAPGTDGRHDAELGGAYPADPAHADRAGDAPAGRARQRPGKRAEEQRR